MVKNNYFSRFLGKVGLGLAVLGTLAGCGNKDPGMVYHENLGAYAPQNYRVENATGANKNLLESDYAALPMVESQKKYIFPGAKKVIHFIGQVHDDPLNPMDSLKRAYNIKDWKKDISQNNLYYFLDYLSENEDVNKIYAEGIYSDQINKSAKQFQLDNMVNLADNYLKKFNDSDNLFLRYGPHEKERLIRDLSKYPVRDFLEDLSVNSGLSSNYYWYLYKNHVKKVVGESFASLRMAYEGRFNLLPFESKEIHETSFEYLKLIAGGKEILCDSNYLSSKSQGFIDSLSASIHHADSLFDVYAFDKREDYFIETFSKSPYSEGYLVLGKAHNLLDNLEKYNKKNPKNKISLDEIILSEEGYSPQLKERNLLLDFSKKNK